MRAACWRRSRPSRSRCPGRWRSQVIPFVPARDGHFDAQLDAREPWTCGVHENQFDHLGVLLRKSLGYFTHEFVVYEIRNAITFQNTDVAFARELETGIFRDVGRQALEHAVTGVGIGDVPAEP